MSLHTQHVAPRLGLLLLAALPASASVVHYSLTGTGDNGSTATGSFSFDDAVIGSNYSNIFAQGDFLSYSVTIQVNGGTPATTVFDLTTSGAQVFVLTKSGDTITDFNPGGSNSDGYSIDPTPYNMGVLTGNGVNETITWSYFVTVPEPQTYAALAALALGSFAGIRRARRFRQGFPRVF